MVPVTLEAFDPEAAKPGDLLVLNLANLPEILVNLGQNSTREELDAALAALPDGTVGMPYQVPTNLLNQKIII